MIATSEEVVLVDREDRPVGRMEKLEAHRRGLLHRAFSVFVFNHRGEMLLQRRAMDKYHSSGLWSNTCCSHPRPGEAVERAAERRLWEEMGMACDLDRRFSFVYRADFSSGLVEHELDHVFVGWSDAVPSPNPGEVAEWRYATPDEIRAEMEGDPALFTAWFRICFERAAEAALTPPAH